MFARYPVPGKAKTRLIPALGAAGAAALHRRLVERSIATIRTSGLPFEIRTTGADADAFREWLGADVPLVDQGDGDLGARLARVPAPGIVLGADIPGLTPDDLIAAADALGDAPVAIGPANDGGYYLLAFRDRVPFLFEDMAWGVDTVAAETCQRLDARGIAYRRLRPLDDLDRPEDLARWGELLP